jgi:hypothetical protein
MRIRGTGVFGGDVMFGGDVIMVEKQTKHASCHSFYALPIHLYFGLKAFKIIETSL